MGTMTAVGWIGVFFLLAVVIRAKVKPVGNMLVPACLIGGIIGCVFMNTTGLPWTTTDDYSLISGQMYNFMFINLGITVAAKTADKKKEKKGGFSIRELRRKMGDSQASGIFGMGSYWALAYSFQALIGFGILCLIGGMWDMDPIYGLTISFAFAQGPGQAVTYGSALESAGWAGAIQVGIMFSAIGFIVAFLLGVPFAKKGIKKGIACSKAEMSEELRVVVYPPEKQESYGKITTYGGNLDTMTFHLALTGFAWVCGKVLCIFLDKIVVGSITLGSTIFFFWGMVAAYIIRYILGKLGLHKYLDRGTQTRITNASTDLMVMATFLAIDIQFLAKWLVPILIISVVVTIVTWVTMRYFGSRFGGSNDFERTLAEWGTVTGTNATGLALTRIVDPNNDTTTAAELGPSNAVNLPASLFVAPGILALGAGAMGLKPFLIMMVLVIVVYLIFMRIIGIWGKKTFDINKGEKYRDGKCYQRMGKPVDE